MAAKTPSSNAIFEMFQTEINRGISKAWNGLQTVRIRKGGFQDLSYLRERMNFEDFSQEIICFYLSTPSGSTQSRLQRAYENALQYVGKEGTWDDIRKSMTNKTLSLAFCEARDMAMLGTQLSGTHQEKIRKAYYQEKQREVKKNETEQFEDIEKVRIGNNYFIEEVFDNNLNCKVKKYKYIEVREYENQYIEKAHSKGMMAFCRSVGGAGQSDENINKNEMIQNMFFQLSKMKLENYERNDGMPLNNLFDVLDVLLEGEGNLQQNHSKILYKKQKMSYSAAYRLKNEIIERLKMIFEPDEMENDIFMDELE